MLTLVKLLTAQLPVSHPSQHCSSRRECNGQPMTPRSGFDPGPEVYGD